MILFFSLYLVVGYLLDFKYHSFSGDAVSRMANGFYVLYSRDPHLASVGFVWNPGTSIADLVPMLFYHLWTPLVTLMFAGSLVSALAMAGMIYQARCTFAEWGVSRLPRLVLVAFLGLNGMILYYGGNGMSEGLYLFTLVATARYLLRWMRDNDLGSLVYAAVALGACYIVRNEAVLPAMAGGMAVLAISYARRTGPRRARIWGGLTDLTIFELPVVVSFLGWATASYVITGQAFGQFSSIYGNSSQEKLAGHRNLHERVLTDVHAIAYLSPTLPILLTIAVYLAVRRRDVGILSPIAIVGGGLAFSLLAYLANSIQPFFRYFIPAVPLEILLVGSLFATAPAVIGAAIPHVPPPDRRRRTAIALGSLIGAATLLVPQAITTVQAMFNPNVGIEEVEFLGFIFHQHLTGPDKAAKSTFAVEQSIADFLVKMHLPESQVIVDNFSPCMPSVITVSPDPKLFVIPNDRDFQRRLDDPLTFGTHYILDAENTGVGALTAPNTTFPTLYATGGGFATNVHTFPAAGQCQAFKLFKVTRHPSQVNG